MGYFYQDWKDKKLFVEDSEGQFVMNFIGYMEYLVDCLKKGKVEVKWNIS